jgi:hypothetical protein
MEPTWNRHESDLDATEASPWRGEWDLDLGSFCAGARGLEQVGALWRGVEGTGVGPRVAEATLPRLFRGITRNAPTLSLRS